jgi:hypothetical protein
VRCEQSGKQGGSASAVDVWASRLAMMSFAAAVVSEVSTGKGFVEVRAHGHTLCCAALLYCLGAHD